MTNPKDTTIDLRKTKTEDANRTHKEDIPAKIPKNIGPFN
jgi:hypothetical protein